MPMTVTIGTAAFLSACTNRMRVCPTPLARAVRMKSCCSTSSMEARMMRAMSAI